MRKTLILVGFGLLACGTGPSPSPSPSVAPPAGQPAPDEVAEVPVASTGASTASWLLWPSSADQVEVVGTWVDGEWVGGRDAPPAPSRLHKLVSLSGEASGSLTGAARTRCDQLLMQYDGPFAGNEVVLLSPGPARPRSVTEVEPEAADRSLAGGLWPGQPDMNPDRVLVADLDGDGVAERIVVLNAEDRDENMGAPLRSALAVVSGDGSPVFSGWPSAPDREDLWDAGVPKEGHRVELTGVADVNADGSLEVVAIHHMEAVHYHGLVVYSFTGGQLMPIGDFQWGERDCYPPSAWSEE